ERILGFNHDRGHAHAQGVGDRDSILLCRFVGLMHVCSLNREPFRNLLENIFRRLLKVSVPPWPSWLNPNHRSRQPTLFAERRVSRPTPARSPASPGSTPNSSGRGQSPRPPCRTR